MSKSGKSSSEDLIHRKSSAEYIRDYKQIIRVLIIDEILNYRLLIHSGIFNDK